MTTREAIRRAIELMGGPVRAAQRLDLRTYQTVQNWCATGRVPAKYCPAIERETGQEVRCEDLFPDADWSFLRGTQCAPSDASEPAPCRA